MNNDKLPVTFPLIIPKKVWYDFTLYGWHFIVMISILSCILYFDSTSDTNNGISGTVIKTAHDRFRRNILYGLSGSMLFIVAGFLKNSYGKWIKNYRTTDSSEHTLGSISISDQIISTETGSFQIQDVARIKIISNRYQNEQYVELYTQSGLAFLQLEMKTGKLNKFNFLIQDLESFTHLQDIVVSWYRMKIPINETHEKMNVKTLALTPASTNEQIIDFKNQNNLHD